MEKYNIMSDQFSEFSEFNQFNQLDQLNQINQINVNENTHVIKPISKQSLNLLHAGLQLQSINIGKFISENKSTKLTPIIESIYEEMSDINDSNYNSNYDLTNNDVNKSEIILCVELTYFSDNLPQIKSYYEMTQIKYDELTTMYMDIYIENFLNGENLTKDKLDIHLISNHTNINIIHKFLTQFGNPFDILGLIMIKKNNKFIDNQIYKSNKFDKSSKKILTNFSDKSIDSDSDYDSDYDSESEANYMTDTIFNLGQMYMKTKSNIKSNVKSNVKSTDNLNDKSDDKSTNIKSKIKDNIMSDSDSDIQTMTEIIETYNKSGIVDKIKMKKLSTNRPDLLEDQILSEINQLID